MNVTQSGNPKFLRMLLVATTAVVLSACGGGSSKGVASDPQNNNPQTSSVACEGTRAWNVEVGGNTGTKTVISEGGGTLGVVANSKLPCAIFWEVNEAETCSDGYQVETWFSDIVNRQLPADLALSVSGNKLTVTAEGDTDEGTLSRLTLDSIRQLPDC